MNIGTIAPWLVIIGFIIYAYIKFKPEIDKTLGQFKKQPIVEKSIDDRIRETEEKILKQKKLNKLTELERQLNNETFK
jgi:hypothetical protein